MIRVAICDDLEYERDILREKLERYQKENNLSFLIDEYADGRELVEHFAKQYDILILDVEMREMDGVTAARKIREVDVTVKIFFSTQYKQYAYDSFSVDPEGYLLKSEPYESFERLLGKTLRRIQMDSKKIELTYQSEVEFVEINQILYAQYSDGAVVVRLIDGRIAKTRGALKEFLIQDKEHVLLSIDRNTVVNLMWIDNCQNGMLSFKTSSKTFKIARRRRSEVEERFFSWCRGRVMDD
ncbi:MAG: LytTR family DNA-binding domain-containing protein [Butyribacter sp.]|nr:LytTR family DNA-binding domain-containing protein [bacterium]MDY3854340.1 LytTR family DNA-binding domain-containing protein [Butyribacter sp.]